MALSAEYVAAKRDSRYPIWPTSGAQAEATGPRRWHRRPNIGGFLLRRRDPLFPLALSIDKTTSGQSISGLQLNTGRDFQS